MLSGKYSPWSKPPRVNFKRSAQLLVEAVGFFNREASYNSWIAITDGSQSRRHRKGGEGLFVVRPLLYVVRRGRAVYFGRRATMTVSRQMIGRRTHTKTNQCGYSVLVFVLQYLFFLAWASIIAWVGAALVLRV
jgi:hypothetical protein